MPTGIIYLVKNTISSKCYIGQTIRTLDVRKTEHFNTTTRIKNNHKFARALRKYPRESWEWSILAEVDVSELSSYENYFIKDLDTFKNGYNTLADCSWGGSGNPKYSPLVYELWHPEYGEIRETRSELCKRNSNLGNHLSALSKGERNCSYGYVLLKNKDKYNEILKIHSFYHPNYGIVTCTSSELVTKYPQYFKSGTTNIHGLIKRNQKLCSGWCLAKYKDSYDDLVDKSSYLTLTHPEHGTLTLKRLEWKKRFGLNHTYTAALKENNTIHRKGWKSTAI